MDATSEYEMDANKETNPSDAAEEKDNEKIETTEKVFQDVRNYIDGIISQKSKEIMNSNIESRFTEILQNIEKVKTGEINNPTPIFKERDDFLTTLYSVKNEYTDAYKQLEAKMNSLINDLREKYDFKKSIFKREIDEELQNWPSYDDLDHGIYYLEQSKL